MAARAAPPAAGDVLWPMLGIGVVAGVWADFLVALRYGGAAMLVWMGVSLVREAHASVPAGMAARESAWAGFTAGLMAIVGETYL